MIETAPARARASGEQRDDPAAITYLRRGHSQHKSKCSCTRTDIDVRGGRVALSVAAHATCGGEEAAEYLRTPWDFQC